MAHALGVRSTLDPVPSIGLGSNVVSVLDMASAYATLAAGGVYSQPMAIRKVVLPGGRVDKASGWGQPDRKRVIPDGVAYEVTKILEQNLLDGTGTRAYFGRPAAGKTGTTDNHTDAWFCGYTPTLATAVWVGYPNSTIEMTSVHGISVSGGSFPARSGISSCRVRLRRSCCGLPSAQATGRLPSLERQVPERGRLHGHRHDGHDTRQDGHRRAPRSRPTGHPCRRRRGSGTTAADRRSRHRRPSRLLRPSRLRRSDHRARDAAPRQRQRACPGGASCGRDGSSGPVPAAALAAGAGTLGLLCIAVAAAHPEELAALARSCRRRFQLVLAVPRR